MRTCASPHAQGWQVEAPARCAVLTRPAHLRRPRASTSPSWWMCLPTCSARRSPWRCVADRAPGGRTPALPAPPGHLAHAAKCNAGQAFLHVQPHHGNHRGLHEEAHHLGRPGRVRRHLLQLGAHTPAGRAPALSAPQSVWWVGPRQGDVGVGRIPPRSAPVAGGRGPQATPAAAGAHRRSCTPPAPQEKANNTLRHPNVHVYVPRDQPDATTIQKLEAIGNSKGAAPLTLSCDRCVPAPAGAKALPVLGSATDLCAIHKHSSLSSRLRHAWAARLT